MVPNNRGSPKGIIGYPEQPFQNSELSVSHGPTALVYPMTSQTIVTASEDTRTCLSTKPA